MTTIARTRAELDEALWAPEELAGLDLDDVGDETAPRRAVVMTMGALHDGHLSLVRAAREAVGPDGQVVVTVFVNPLQFGPGEDFDAYPRDLDKDVRTLGSAGAKGRVDVVFAPSADEMYPSGPIVRVTAGPIGQVILQALANAWQVRHDIDRQASQVAAVADTGQHQNLRRMDRAAACQVVLDLVEPRPQPDPPVLPIPLDPAIFRPGSTRRFRIRLEHVHSLPLTAG